MRKIIHIDMDAFYASIEQRDDSSLKGLPVAVGGSSKRGVVMTASYEARTFGVRSAMPIYKAQRLCPDLVIVRPRFDAYKSASRQFRDILQRQTTIIEPLALDEAFIDVSQIAKPPVSATSIAQNILETIRNEISVTASAGISFNKFLAKLASGMNKPDGFFVIKPQMALELLADLPVEKFHGVGPATAHKMKAAGIQTGRDLQKLEEAKAGQLLGSSGLFFRNLARAIDHRPVAANSKRKSVSVETTFFEDKNNLCELETTIETLALDLVHRCERANFSGKTLTLKIKYQDFQIQTRSQTPQRLSMDAQSITELAKLMLGSRPLIKPVRLIGLGISRSNSENHSVKDQFSFHFKDNHSA